MGQMEDRYERMTGAPVAHLICSFAVPSIVCMLISSFYNIVDTFFVGRIDARSTAALGVVFSYMGIIQALAFYFGQGSGNFISRSLGARRLSEASEAAATGFLSAEISAVTVAVACALAIRPVLTLFGATPTVMPYAESYFRWILLGTPFIVGSFVLNNQMRFQGNASLAMFGILTGALLNVVLDPILIFSCGMGVAGAGLATAISQMTGFCVLLFLSGRRGGLGVHPRHFVPSRRYAREINAGGLPSLARQGLMAVSMMLLNNYAGDFGDEVIAAYSIVGRVMHIVTSVILGFGQGFQPVCGFNYGAGKFGRVRSGYRFCVCVASAYAVSAALFGIISAHAVISVFTNDAGVMAVGARILRAQCVTLPTVGFVIMTNMYLQTTRQTASALAVAVSRNGLFLIPALSVGVAAAGLGGLIAAQPVSDAMSVALAVPLVMRALRRMGKSGARDESVSVG